MVILLKSLLIVTRYLVWAPLQTIEMKLPFHSRKENHKSHGMEVKLLHTLKRAKSLTVRLVNLCIVPFTCLSIYLGRGLFNVITFVPSHCLNAIKYVKSNDYIYQSFLQMGTTFVISCILEQGNPFKVGSTLKV